VKPSYLFSIFLFFFFWNSSSYSQCNIDAKLNEFVVTGMSSTIEWQTLSLNSVICYSTDWQPSFYVSQDSLINVKITGNIYTGNNNNDNDFLGFVFGYKSPGFSSESNDNNFFLFDWKKEEQYATDDFGGYFANEGFSLSYTDGIFNPSPDTIYKYFWGHHEGENFLPLAQKYGDEYGWNYATTYYFEIVYTYDRIQIKIDGDEIFDLEGCFTNGLFGLYTLNQSGIVFSNIKYEQVYEIDYFSETESYCEEIPINFQFIDTTCSKIPDCLTHYEWYFEDNNSTSEDLIASHIFMDPGDFEVELRVTNQEGCVDTIYESLNIAPKPQILQQPTDQFCFSGDHITFSVEASYTESYQWYYKTQEMNYWAKVTNNGHFSGAQSKDLHIYNARPAHDQMQLKCFLKGSCENQEVTQVRKLIIIDIPVRATLSPVDTEMCTPDSTLILITLKEQYQIKRANLRLNYDSHSFDFKHYSTYLDNMDYTVISDSNFINIQLYVWEPINIEELIIASLYFKTKNDTTNLSDFSWDMDHTYFLDENYDTIIERLIDTQVQLFKPLQTGLSDSLEICHGTELSLAADSFEDVVWSNGETGNQMQPSYSGLYFVEYTDSNECENIDTFYVALDNLPEKPQSLKFNKNIYCKFDSLILLEVSGGDGSVLRLQHNQTVQNLIYPFIDNIELVNPGYSFDLSVSWLNVCGESEKLIEHLRVLNTSVPSIELQSDFYNKTIGEDVVISAKITDGGENPQIKWFLDQNLLQFGTQTSFTSSDFGRYQEIKAELISDAACILGSNKAADSINIELEYGFEYYIPSLVSVNSDGKDDAFKVIFNDTEIQDFNLQLYDLSGKLIYETNNPYFEWDGNNDTFSSGVELFLYSLKFKLKNKKERSINGKFVLMK
jgi:PKD repeat protein